MIPDFPTHEMREGTDCESENAVPGIIVFVAIRTRRRCLFWMT